MESKRLAIVCDVCGEETFLRREARYEGFKKVGERVFCAACGHEFPEESQIPYVETKSASVFDDSDKTPVPAVFAEDEPIVNCRRCRHYVVNPFVQRCGLHGRRVEATDVCADFEAADEMDVNDE